LTTLHLVSTIQEPRANAILSGGWGAIGDCRMSPKEFNILYRQPIAKPRTAGTRPAGNRLKIETTLSLLPMWLLSAIFSVHEIFHVGSEYLHLLAKFDQAAWSPVFTVAFTYALTAFILQGQQESARHKAHDAKVRKLIKEWISRNAESTNSAIRLAFAQLVNEQTRFNADTRGVLDAQISSALASLTSALAEQLSRLHADVKAWSALHGEALAGKLDLAVRQLTEIAIDNQQTALSAVSHYVSEMRTSFERSSEQTLHSVERANLDSFEMVGDSFRNQLKSMLDAQTEFARLIQELDNQVKLAHGDARDDMRHTSTQLSHIVNSLRSELRDNLTVNANRLAELNEAIEKVRTSVRRLEIPQIHPGKTYSGVAKVDPNEGLPGGSGMKAFAG